MFFFNSIDYRGFLHIDIVKYQLRATMGTFLASLHKLKSFTLHRTADISQYLYEEIPIICLSFYDWSLSPQFFLKD